MLKQVLIWPRPVKRAVVMTVDVILAVLAIPIFTRFGLYRAIFRYTGLDTLYSTGKAVALYALIVIAIHSWNMWPTFPLTLGVLQPIIFFLLVSASRVLAQFWLTGISLGKQPSQGRMLP